MTATHFPRFHARPATGWVNDPNGIGYWEGRWHVMCQHNPDAPVWGPMTWAHLSSSDLVTWQEQPLALVPRVGAIDDGGAWSGVAHLLDGEPALIYTAIPHEGTPGARVAVARRDGDRWVQPSVGVTGPAPEGVRDVRDPFLFQVGERLLAVQGAGTEDGIPLVLLYDASDIDAWRPLGELLRGDDPAAARWAPGRLWECPQLVQFGDTWVLIVSLWDDSLPGCAEHGPQETAWLAGSLTPEGADDPAGLRFVVTSGGRFDEGSAVYAPQVAIDPSTGEALAWGWAWEGTRSVTPEPEPGQEPRDWAGMLTFPRVLSWSDGRLRSAFAPQVLAAFGEPTPLAGSLPVTCWLARVVSGDGVAGVVVSLTDGGATVEFSGADVVVTFDGSILEAIADGIAVTHRLYPRDGQRFEISAFTSDGSLLEVVAAVPDLATGSPADSPDAAGKASQ